MASGSLRPLRSCVRRRRRAPTAPVAARLPLLALEVESDRCAHFALDFLHGCARRRAAWEMGRPGRVVRAQPALGEHEIPLCSVAVVAHRLKPASRRMLASLGVQVVRGPSRRPSRDPALGLVRELPMAAPGRNDVPTVLAEKFEDVAGAITRPARRRLSSDSPPGWSRSASAPDRGDLVPVGEARRQAHRARESTRRAGHRGLPDAIASSRRETTLRQVPGRHSAPPIPGPNREKGNERAGQPMASGR